MTLKHHLRILVLCASADHIHAADATIDFVRDIEPIFQERCLDCHNPDEAEGAFRVDIDIER